MKAFSLIEIVLSMIILSFILLSFGLFYKQLYKNYENLTSFSKLYELERKLYENPQRKNILLHFNNLKASVFEEEYIKEDFFELGKLRILDENYSSYFQ